MTCLMDLFVVLVLDFLARYIYSQMKPVITWSSRQLCNTLFIVYVYKSRYMNHPSLETIWINNFYCGVIQF